MRSFRFQVRARDRSTEARRGILVTARGEVDTPVFMPVGTYAAVRSISPDELTATGSRMILGNTYHLYLRPGHETIRRLGGLHRFMGWDGPILTDSGGFQVYSLAGLRTVRDDGVSFRSHLDGSSHLLTPEKAIEIQAALGSDVFMVLDDCPEGGAPPDVIARSMRRTTGWAARSKEAAARHGGDHALFGIVQGGTFEDLRREHAERIVGLGFDGYAVGGVSVGEPPEEIHRIGDLTGPLLPAEAPRYIMGLGAPADIVRLIGSGFDMFDCVMPTRNARNGTLFTRRGALHIKNEAFKEDGRPVDEACRCLACRRFGRAYLRHLFMSREILGHRLNTIHNLTYYQDLMGEAREAIERGGYAAWSKATLGEMTDRGEGQGP